MKSYRYRYSMKQGQHSQRFRYWRKWVDRAALFGIACLACWCLATGVSPATQSGLGIAPSSVATARDPLQLEREGRSLYDAGQFSAAAATWEDAANGFAERGDALGRAGSLNYLSMALLELGRWQDARTAVEEAVRLSSGTDGNRALLAQALNNQGRIQLAVGNEEAALETWREAASAYELVGDEVGRLGAIVNQGLALQSLGLYRRSETTLETASEQIAALSDPRLQAAALRHLGVTLQVVGDLQRSQTLLERSLAIARELNAPSDVGATLTALGNSARSLQKFEDALSLYRQAAAALASLPHEAVTAQLNELNLLVELQRWEDARSQAQTLQAAIAELPPSRSRVYAAVNWADSALQLARTTPGTIDRRTLADILIRAIDTARTIDDTKAEAYALAELGNLYSDSQQWQEALDLTQQAILLADRLNASEMSWKWQVQLGKLHQQQGKSEKAIAAYSEAVRTLSSLRQDLVAMNADLQFSFRDRVEPVYRDLVGLLLATPTQKHLMQARETMEAFNLAELDNFFREACLTAQPMQVDSIDPKAAAIYPIILPDPTAGQVRLEVILSSPGQPLHHHHTLISQAEFDSAVDRFRQSLSLSFPQSDRLKLYATLYDWLIRPMEAELQERRTETLVFILDGSLRNLPMSVLYDGDRYLIEKYAIALTPGLQLLEPRPLENDRLQAFVGGISESRQGFPALPEVPSEISQIGREISTRVKIDGEFTTEAVKSALAEHPSSILHFATHGQFSSNASDTFILTWDSRINVSELQNWLGNRDETQSQAIELLVLSACQTARGDTRAVLGLAGFAVKSGARATLATLWSVRDESTAALMAQFYRQLALPNVTKSEALRQAQISLLRNSQYSHPFYWAPFVLVGNWL